MSKAEPDNIPRHVAIIMDGNGRWAQARGLKRIDGHRAGAESVRRVVEACSEAGIEYLTLYAFSTENWQRPRSEVRALMDLLRLSLAERLGDLRKHRVRLNVIGDVGRLPKAVQKTLSRVMAETRDFDAGTLTLALNYGARAEIASAARRLSIDVKEGRVEPDSITEELFADYLYTAGLPDPDLIIRTANEMRLSNFLLWQASYAEFWVTPTLWPDFGGAEFLEAIRAYSARARRFGGLSSAG